MKQLLSTIKGLRQELDTAKQQLAVAEATMNLAVQSAKFEVKTEMEDKVSAAYDKGYTRCKEALEANMALLKAFKAMD